MFIDGRGVDDGAVIETDLAVIGAGAAGITIARALRDSGLRIALIESGGLEPDPETQGLYAGPNTGNPVVLDQSRLRFFGGSTNHWGGWCRPMAPIDFEARDWVPHSGWPIARAELDPYYVKANEVCRTGPFHYDDADAWSEGGANQPLPLPGGEVVTRWFQHSPPLNFGEAYRGDIERAEAVRCLLHSNVLEIVPDEHARTVERIRVGTLTGRRFEVRPRLCVLATGGIENARVLLLSTSVATAGLGNGAGLVGRFFMDHPHIHLPVEILMTDRALLSRYYRAQHYPMPEIDGVFVTGVLMFTEEYLRGRQRLGTVVVFYDGTDVGAGTPPGPEDPAPELAWALAGLIRDTTSKSASSPEGGVRFATGCWTEQAPNPDSRVLLSPETDAFGLRRSQLDWRLSDEDRTNVEMNMLALARAFGRWGEALARVRFPEHHDWAQTVGGNHHMGTTRMAADADHGVVDADCRVHGLSNLYLAGSSVFTTSSTVNPTLTIVALALRLADHIRGRFSRGLGR